MVVELSDVVDPMVVNHNWQEGKMFSLPFGSNFILIQSKLKIDSCGDSFYEIVSTRSR